jgi:hypothetical protein
MQHVEERAQALRDAGIPGTWEELKVRATLDLLQERDSRPVPGPGHPDPGEPDPGSPGSGGPSPDTPDTPGTPGPGQGPSIGAQVTITVPATALDGDDGPPGEVDPDWGHPDPSLHAVCWTC